MSKERGNGKTKKVVIGVATVVAVAAIAVPTALTLTGGKDGAGASTSNNKYNIIVSAGIDNVPDYSLSIQEGTKIGELKTILKAIDGYSMEGIYKDEAMQHAYSDEDTITSSTKIYIKFVAVTYTVNIYSEDGTTLLTTQEVSHKDTLTLDTPTKPEDEFATYEFKGWYNERNEQVNLNEITSDLNIHPYFETHMKEYKIGFIYEAFKSSISVSIGGEPVTLESTYHYGASIVVRATQPVGRDITEFKVNVGGTTTDVLTELYRHEENGQVYYEIELTGNGDLSITYNEAVSEYSLGNIPSQVTVKRNNKVLTSADKIYYGDQLEISYRETEGYEKETFHIDGAELVGVVYVVKGNLTIEYTESRLAYTLGTIPSGVTVTRGDETLTGNIKVYYGDTLTFTYTTITERISNTKQENGYNYSEKETTTYTLKVNGLITNTGANISVSDNITLELSHNISKEWIQGSRIEYKLGTIPNGVVVQRNGTPLTTGSILYYYDLLTFSYSENSTSYTGNTKQEKGYNYSEIETINYTLKVNGSVVGSGSVVAVTNDVILSLTSASSKVWEQGSRIEYSLSTIPEGVIVKQGEETINSNTKFYYGEQLTITYDTDYDVVEFKINGADIISKDTYSITDNINIIFNATWKNSYYYLTFSECEGGVEVSAFDNSVTEVTIPSTYKGQPVIGIKQSSIFNSGVFEQSSITSVVIMDGVKNIGSSAFNKCDSLTSVVLGNGVTKIGNCAFQYCSNLTSVTIPTSVTDINAYAFGSCKGLNSLIIPKNVKVLGTGAFWYCENLTSVTFEEGITSIGTGDGSGIFFGCSSLTSVTIPSSVTKIVKRSFSNCNSLTSLKVSDKNKIYTSRDLSGNELNCIIEKETKILLQGCNVTIIPSDGSISSIGDLSFEYCNGLSSIVIPEGVFSIGNSFMDCSNLTSIILPSSLTSIGSYAFSYCTELSSITIPRNVVSIGGNAFDHCDKLYSVTFENSTGWRVDDVAINITSTSQAASYLRNTYKGKKWTRSDS